MVHRQARIGYRDHVLRSVPSYSRIDGRCLNLITISAGTGVGGFVFPFVMKALIKRFGYKIGMCCVVGLSAQVEGRACVYCRPRRPPPTPLLAGSASHSSCLGSPCANPVRWTGHTLGRVCSVPSRGPFVAVEPSSSTFCGGRRFTLLSATTS